MRENCDVILGGLWEEDVKRLEEDWPEYEILEVTSEDGHHYTAYLRRKW